MKNEWYTPVKYINSAREVLGTIDLDPASSLLANQTVQATSYFTEQDNGLNKDWYGNVWLNPPFTASIDVKLPQFTWALKLLDEYRSGRVTQAIILLATSHRKWFHRLWEMTDALMCISEERIHFFRPDQTRQELREPMCFLYLGLNEQRFIDVFGEFGSIAKRVNKINADKPKQLELIS